MLRERLDHVVGHTGCELGKTMPIPHASHRLEDSYTHDSAENTSALPRKTLAVRFVDADVRVVASRLPSPEVAAYLPTDEEGRLEGAMFPLLVG